MIRQLVTRFATGLRDPTLFKLVGALFLVDFFVPDLVPFIDEILLGLGTRFAGRARLVQRERLPQQRVERRQLAAPALAQILTPLGDDERAVPERE